MTKLKPIAIALMVAGASTLATANELAPAPPPFYDNGPTSPLTNETDINYAERKAYGGLEAAMTILESHVHAYGCSGSYDVEVVADFEGAVQGLDNYDPHNYVKIDKTTLLMDLQTEDPDRGQMVKVKQSGAGTVGGNMVANYAADFTFNNDDNIMDGVWSTMYLGRNGPDPFSGFVIKDFYLGSVTDTAPYGDDILYDWGLQSSRKQNKPVEKWWQRSKSRRSNTFAARTVFQKDRLVGFTPCRITIQTDGINNGDWFEQYGTAKITRVTPIAAMDELDSVSN
jgi:hypothetical protein